MPNTQTAKKRMRQSSKRRIRNRARKSVIRTAARKIETAIGENDANEAQAQYREFQGRIDRAAKGSTLHPNKAARRKSRMQKRINALKAQAAK